MVRQKFTSQPQLKFILCMLEHQDLSSAHFAGMSERKNHVLPTLTHTHTSGSAYPRILHI